MTTPRASGPNRAAVLTLGIVFLAAAGFWAWTALERGGEPEARVVVRARVLDEEGVPLARAQVRSRYGGEWVGCDAKGEVVLRDPRTKESAGGVEAALADALEGRAVYHAARRGDKVTVARGADGTLVAELRLAHCGILRLGVAPSGLPGARARVDDDLTGRRWRLAEGRDVIRAGEAASYVVFEGAGEIWVTLEGDRGVAQSRLKFEAPGPGMRLEKSLSPGPAAPIRGRVVLPEGAWVPTLAGQIEVTEIEPLAGERIARLPVRVEPDGSFLVDYVGHGRYELSVRVPFARVELPVGAAGGDADVRVQAEPRPWIEVGPPELAALAQPPRVALFGADGPEDLLAQGSAVPVPQGLAVPCPKAGVYRVLLHQRGSDASPPRSGTAEVSVGREGPTPALVSLEDLPHGALLLKVADVPERGGVARVEPDRSRTLLPRVGSEARFDHLPVGQARVWIVWQDEHLAQEILEVQVANGATGEVLVRPQPGVLLRLDSTGSALEHDPRPLTLRWAGGATPYGAADARIALDREEGGATLRLRGALKPGAYRAVVEPGGTTEGPHVPVEFVLEAGKPATVRLGGA